ncbi:MAG: hypothetical protein LC804_25980 [Acidobacteria bacterium]|nr:hypothetical protein [Acidobacteriota bacterium]
MHRPHRASVGRVVPVLFGLAVLAVGCSGGGEYQFLKQYFDASRLRDSTTVGNIATVSFSPQTDGTVQSFEVVSVSDVRRRPLKLRELAKTHAAARAADDEFSKRKRAYQDTNGLRSANPARGGARDRRAQRLRRAPPD